MKRGRLPFTIQLTILAVINYRPGENLFDMFKPGKVVTVFIPKKYLISAIEDEEERKIWGTDTYTDASDIIAVCQHTGKLNLSDINRYQSFINGALVDVRIREPLKYVFIISFKIDPL